MMKNMKILGRILRGIGLGSKALGKNQDKNEEKRIIMREEEKGRIRIGVGRGLGTRENGKFRRD